MSKVINMNEYKKKIPYEEQMELDKLVEEIKELECFLTRWIKKGRNSLGIDGELNERTELVIKFLNMCDIHRIDSKQIHDFGKFDKLLEKYKNK